jgi:S-adenosylmethionine decarboxylase
MDLIQKTKCENKVVSAEVYNFQEWISITDPDVLKESFSGLLDYSGYHVLNYMEHLFPNGGFTVLWLLAESHLAIHTFIEEQKTYIELSGCNKAMNKKFREAFFLKFENQLVEGNTNQSK